AFELSTFFLDRRALRQIVHAIPAASVVAFRPYKERLCEFKISGVAFLVHEAFGESERYWVGPAEAGWSPHLAAIRETFARARPFLWFVRF
ncbi:MAG TPA: hypothetical protein VGG91_19495, partial [Myxococcaceae bacterium]